MKDPKMVAALKLLKKLQDKHSGVVESTDLPEESRSLLVSTGFLRQVSKGWYVCSRRRLGLARRFAVLISVYLLTSERLPSFLKKGWGRNAHPQAAGANTKW